MKLPGYEYSKSSFLGIQKDCALIMQKILGSPTILKLLWYGDTRDWKDKPTVTAQNIKEMFATKQISIVPKVKVEKPEKTYLRVCYNTILPNATNPVYVDNNFEIKIICHYDNWDLGDYDLRPYRIAGEINALLDGARLTGIGRLEFKGLTPDIYDEEFAGVTLSYLAIRGNEDKVRPLE